MFKWLLDNSLANRLLIIAHPVALPTAPTALMEGD